MAILQIKKVSKQFGGVAALREVSLDVEEHRITALIGWVLVDYEQRRVSGSYTTGIADAFKIFFVPIAGFLEAARSDKDTKDKMRSSSKNAKSNGRDDADSDAG